MHSTDSIEFVACYHCGEECNGANIRSGNKSFCCTGCRMVYSLLHKNGLCEYYELNNAPGSNQRITVRTDKFAFLDDESIQRKLTSFASEGQLHIQFYLPQIHCSSCLYLLENLHRIEKGIISSRIDFARKEVSLVLDPNMTSIRKAAEVLTGIGYEPYISLNDLADHRPPAAKKLLYQLGVAGFCFANIMMLSFPEYLGLETNEHYLQQTFRTISLLLSLPVVIFCAAPFYVSGWNGLRHKFLNIDAPIAVAILVTFGRSVYEIFSGTGGGYLDSMSGIVFFMLAGRVLQDKTYRQLSFERDFTSYFPIAVSVIKDDKQVPTLLPNIKVGDTIRIHSEELIPTDAIITRGHALIDYSFVTGESLPVQKEMGELLYAGGKQKGAAIELLVIKEVTQSYLTSLWSKEDLKKERVDKQLSFVHLFSRYFTYVVFSIALLAAVYWWYTDRTQIVNAVTAVLIVACPCALLLSNTFTNAVIIRVLGRNKLYLRNAEVIERIATANHIVFDKTGTLTHAGNGSLRFEGRSLTPFEKKAIATIAAQSGHPLSQPVVEYLGTSVFNKINLFSETAGKGVEGKIDDYHIRIGTKEFVTGLKEEEVRTRIYVSINRQTVGFFELHNQYRSFTPDLLRSLSSKLPVSIISGDNDGEKSRLSAFVTDQAQLKFRQSPEDKFHYIQELQRSGKRVIMIGDGLNDAGALKQSDVGIAVTENSNNFTPSSDGIMDVDQLRNLPLLIAVCRANKKIISFSFIVSIIYNIIGIFFAVQGKLSPMIAAILMPSSSLCILLITYGGSSTVANWYARKVNRTKSTSSLAAN